MIQIKSTGVDLALKSSVRNRRLIFFVLKSDVPLRKNLFTYYTSSNCVRGRVYCFHSCPNERPTVCL